RRRLRGDRDLLAGCRVAARPRLRRRLHAHGELDEAADLHLLGVADLLEHDLLERREDVLHLGAAEVGALGDFGGKLGLSQSQGALLAIRWGWRRAIQAAAPDRLPDERDQEVPLSHTVMSTKGFATYSEGMTRGTERAQPWDPGACRRR